MISRVLLRNWRGYEKLSLDFGPGLTFVIAANGVGKTSLVNGVCWAIFGDASDVDGEAALRAGSQQTSAEVDFTLGETPFSVTRTRERRGRQSLVVRADGDDMDPGELPQRLAAAARVPHEILPQLMFVPEMRLTHEGGLFADVQEHLAALLGIDRLRDAAKTARTVQLGAAKEIQATKDAARLDAASIDAIRSRIVELDAELERLDLALAEDRDRQNELDAVHRQLQAWSAYDDQLARYRERLDDSAAEARAIGLDPDPDEVARAQREVGDEARQLDTALRTTQAEEALVVGLVEQLESADPVCPVCLRPVDDQVAQHASHEHLARLAELADQQAATERRQRDVDAAAKKIAAIASSLSRLRPPDTPGSPRPDLVEEDLLLTKTTLESAMADKAARKGALGELLRQAREAIDEAEASAAAATDLTQLHAVAATARSLEQLATAEADARTERSLDPISQTLASRWAEFFVASSARPRLAGGGNIELGRGSGAAIPYSSFSGGEKTLASLLTRLLFVTSATGLRSMWLDEPLEHLDPANRTRVARLLAQVAQRPRHMRQVVVTTYEEGLARSMVGRHDETNIVYVSTDDLL